METEAKKEVARDRFSGALSSALDRADQQQTAHNSDLLDGIPDLTAGLDTPLKRIINSSSPWNSPTKSPRSNRRRRKKEPMEETAFHHTFVMKLFDRSVDLAQFPHNTALYPVCRAWIKNQPHNTNFAPRVRTPTPEPEEEEDPLELKILPKLANGDKEEEKADLEDEFKDVEEHLEEETRKRKKKIYKLPHCEPLAKKENGVEQVLRIPNRSKPKIAKFNLEKIQDNCLTVPSLLGDHMAHWQSVRQDWKSSYAKNEERYQESMKVLKEMFHA